MKPNYSALRRRQLDRELAALRPLSGTAVPPGGWLRAIREALGMTLRQAGSRAGISDRAFAQIEEREADAAVTLATLDRAARVVGCRLVYALVPETTLEKQVTSQAESAAARLVGRIEHSMQLEEQPTDAAMQRLRQDELADDLVRRGDRRIWDGGE